MKCLRDFYCGSETPPLALLWACALNPLAPYFRVVELSADRRRDHFSRYVSFPKSQYRHGSLSVRSGRFCGTSRRLVSAITAALWGSEAGRESRGSPAIWTVCCFLIEAESMFRRRGGRTSAQVFTIRVWFQRSWSNLSTSVPTALKNYFSTAEDQTVFTQWTTEIWLWVRTKCSSGGRSIYYSSRQQWQKRRSLLGVTEWSEHYSLIKWFVCIFLFSDVSVRMWRIWK